MTNQSHFYYYLCKKKKVSEIVHKLKRISTIDCINYINSIVLLPVDSLTYLLVDLDSSNPLNLVLCYKSIYRFFGGSLVTKHADGKISKVELETLISNSLSAEEEKIKLEEGVCVKVPWGNKLRVGVIKYIQGSYVYVDLSEQGYPLVAKIEINKIKAINSIEDKNDAN